VGKLLRFVAQSIVAMIILIAIIGSTKAQTISCGTVAYPQSGWSSSTGQFNPIISIEDYKYVVEPDVWGINSSYYEVGNQNITIPSNSVPCFVVSAFNLSLLLTPSYPSILAGGYQYYNNIDYTTNWQDIRVSNLANASYNWNVTDKNTNGNYLNGTYDIASDMWFTSSDNTIPTHAPGSTEVMIWLDAHNINIYSAPLYALLFSQYNLLGLTKTFTSGGITYNVYCTYNLNVPDTFVIFTPSVTGLTSANINILNFTSFLENSSNFKYNYLCNRGNAPIGPSWYLRQIPVGFELFDGGVGLKVDSFSASVSPKANVFSPPNLSITKLLSSLNISNPKVQYADINIGINDLLTDSNATGGSGLYSYQWLEEAPGANTFSNPDTGCEEGSRTTKYLFATECNAVNGIYHFKLKVTDNVTFDTVNSSEVNVYVSGNPAGYQSILAYVPLTVSNEQSSPIANGTPFAVTFNALKYSSYALNSNLSNICVAYNGACITAWIQGNLTQGVDQGQFTYPLNQTSDIIWVKAPATISADSNSYAFSIIIFNSLVNNYQNSSSLGANPTLWCNSGCPSNSYAGVDNGEKIFSSYNNFIGSNSGSNGQINQNLTIDGGSWSIDNGLTVSSPGFGGATFYSAPLFNSSSNISIDGMYPQYELCSVGGGAEGCGGLIGGGFFYVNPNAFACTETNAITGGCDAGYNYFLIRYDFGAIADNGSWCSCDSSSIIPSVYTDAGTEDYNESNTLPNGIPDTLTQTISDGRYVLTSNYGFGNTIFDQPSYTNGTDQDSFAFELDSVNGYPGTFYTNYIIERRPLPNGQQPVTIDGTPTLSYLNQSNYADAVTTNSIYTISIFSLNPQDLLQMVITYLGDSPIVVNGTGNVNYTICSSPSTCLPAGAYEINVTDMSSGYSEAWVLDIANSPTVTLNTSNQILDQDQQMYINTTVLNGSGIFDYQWYNATSGNDVSMSGQNRSILLFNATNPGTYKYNMLLTDVGTANAISVRSANATVIVKSALSVNLTQYYYPIITGNTITINSMISGGTGNFLYQWYNFSSEIFPVPIPGQTSNALTVALSSVGNYSYFVSVTDNGTTTSPKGSVLSVPTNITVKNMLDSPPPAAANYIIPVNIANQQQAPLIRGTQIMLTFNALEYSGLFAPNMQNMCFYDSITAKCMPSWLEGSLSYQGNGTALDTRTDLVYWIKMDENLPANFIDSGNYVIAVFPKSSDEYVNPSANMGVAPELYCASGCPASYYGQYDDGAKMFGFYTNFSGTTLKGWTEYDGPTVTQDNGLTVEDTGYNDVGLYSNSTGGYDGQNAVIDAYVDIETPFAFDYWGVGQYNGGIALATIAGGGNQYGIGYTSSGIFTGYNLTIRDYPSTSNTYILTYANNGTSQASYANYSKFGVGNTIAESNSNITIFALHAGATILYQWIRARSYPPNGVLPNITTYKEVSVSAPSLNITLSPASNTVTLGSPVTFTNTTIGGLPPYYFTYNVFEYGAPAQPGNYVLNGNSITFLNYMGSNHLVATFNVLESVTDSNGTIATSSNSVVTVNWSPVLPQGVREYLPITLFNYQNTALTANTPIAIGTGNTFTGNVIGFNAIAYQQYETCNLDNAEFFFVNGTIISSWLEGNILNEIAANTLCTSSSSANALAASANILYWIDYPWPSSFLPANTGSNTIYLGWAGNVVSAANTLFGYNSLYNSYTGEAPQLSCNNPSNTITGCTAGQYGEYDYGSNIFKIYYNFIGTSTPSGLIASGTYTQDNGIYIPSKKAATANTVTYYSPGTSNVFEGLIQYTGDPTAKGWADFGAIAPGTNSCKKTNNGICWILTGNSAGVFQPEIGTDTGAAITYDLNWNVYSAYWPTSTKGLFNFNYGTTNTVTATASLSEPFGVSADSSDVNGINLQWIRIRQAPPNDILPGTVIGNVI